MPHSKPSQDQTQLDRDPTSNSSAPPEPGLDQKLGEARLRRLDAQAREAEAKATEAEYSAAAEPKRQRMTLKERRTHLKLEVTKVQAALLAGLASLVIVAVSVILNPAISPLSALVFCLGLIADQLRRRASKSRGEEHDPDP